MPFFEFAPLGTWEFTDKNTMKHRKYFTVVYVVIILFAIKNYVNGQNINVCYNSSKEITLQSSDTRWMYVWEKKNALASIWNLVGSGISVNIEYVTQNIDVRCSADTNSDGVGDSVVYQVQLVPYQELVAANISGGGFICHGSISPDLYITDLATGGGDSYSYQWMYSDNGENSWVNIPNAVQTSLSGQMLTSTRYYRLQTTSTMGCGTKYSNVTQVNVYNPLIPPVLGIDNSSICYDSFPSPLFMVSEAQGGIGNFSLQWQQEVNGSFVDIEGATAEIYQPSALRFTSTYRLSATNACGTVFSSPLTVIVYPILESGTIETEKTVCYNTSTTISFVNIPTGGGEQYNYQWQYSENGVTWNNISTSSVSSSLITQNLISTTYYRCIVSSVLGCSSDTTNVCTARVLNPIVAGTIAHDTIVCYNTSPGLIRMTIDASGGKEPYTYQWQTSTNGSDWANVVDATSSSYQVPLLTSSRYYKLNQISSMGCGTVSTNMIMIGVLPNITPASIETMTTTGLCYDSIPANLNISMSPTGADGMFSYQWQESVNGEWNSILGATASSYQPVALRETHSYRLITVSDYGCGSRISNEVSINVFPRINAGTLSNQLLCYKESTTIMSNPVGGGNSYTYQWQQSVDDMFWTDISMANGDRYTTPELIDTANYRLIVASALGCSSDTTNSVEIAVLPSFVAGEIAHDTTICYNTSPDLLRMTTDAIGGMQPYTYQWQVSTDNANFTDITLAENINYQPSTLVQTQYYRLQFTSSLGCGTLYSDTVVVNVYDDLTIPVISSNTQTTICYDSVPHELFILTDPTGGNGIFTHQWQILSGNLWTNIEEDANDTIYQPKNLTDTISYRLISTSTYGCGEVVSEPYTINVYPIIQAGTISGITPICYNTESTISFALFPQGGGDTYTYQWQQSVDDINWNDISMANENSYTTPKLTDTVNYRLIVTSALGCSADTTSSSAIAVRPEFLPGTIATHLDSACYGEKPNYRIDLIDPCIGGAEPYSYQWIMWTDTTNMSIAPHGNTAYYQPDTIYDTTYYKLIFISSDNCGEVESNIHTIKMNPLPIPHNIEGMDTVCYTQYETYTLPTACNDYSYSWTTENGNGEVTYLTSSNDSVEIYWKNSQTLDKIIVEVEDNVTGCKSNNYKQVLTRSTSAPSRTIVIRKPNSNILICQEESPSLYYQWGYTVKATGEEVVIENSNRRYVLLPHEFDSITYSYWVELLPQKSSYCYSRSYYNPLNDSQIEEPSSSKVIVPSIANYVVPITINNRDENSVYCEAYTISGILVHQKDLGKAPYITYNIESLRKNSLYVVRVKVGNEIFIYKTFVK